jgi:large subunit ribosomal protein L21
MKYAIIETGGKQFQVQAGDEIEVELLHRDEGEAVEFEQVLLVQDQEQVKIGQPVVKGAVVKAEVISLTKGPKVIAYKYERRANEQTKRGHRQNYTRVRITEIVH